MAKSMKPGGGGRFKKLEGELKRKGVKNPGGLAASIGNKKWGKKRMKKWSQAAKNRAAEKVGK